ncbi:dihydrofolate reductase family protein [Microbacterium sp. 179-B 1A2 NHS]|uniref:dihydrofolate reductase family protein n=1 Tax=Microbacterium sp. 179-B 1A2 NHS TaxID=3142383 RepID=UPI0039A339AD
MGRLIYFMVTSLDGYATGPDGQSDWGIDRETHDFATEQSAGIGTYLYGRRMYETMVCWETAHLDPEQDPSALAYADVWRAAEKVVFSRTLDAVASERTRLVRDFDPIDIARMKAESDADLSIDGPTLAAQAIRAGLVDEYRMLVAPVVAGGGIRFLPDGVGLDLDLRDERRFGNGMVFLSYGVRGPDQP